MNMRLEAGAIRELHWHKQAEWAFMLAGTARVTAIDPEGRNFIADIRKGDLWTFPAGIPHSIQGLENGCEFLLVFDYGGFSENETFLLTDWLAHTPREVLARNFGVNESLFSGLPSDVEHERYIFQGTVPGPLGSDAVHGAAGGVPIDFAYRLSEEAPVKAPGGQVRIVDSKKFRPASTIAAALVEIEPGGMREMHWHPNTDEWQYYISGTARMSVFASGGKARTFDFAAGDVGYVPFAMGHYVLNTGDETLRMLELFRSDHYTDVSLHQWLGLVPPELVQTHLNVGDEFTLALKTGKSIIVR